MKNLLVIDGNSIMNRQYYGVRPLTTGSGLFTNAVYGFINVLLSTLDRLKPEYAAVAFDVHAPTFRHKMYGEYKAGRHGTPPELLMQFPYIKKCLVAMGITVIEKEGYEADDILGTLSHLAASEGDTHAYILTGDKDSLQLISEGCTVLLATNNKTVDYDKEVFKEQYGILPDCFVDVKALMGDSSDNIPGVRGIGEKTALKIIAEYGSIERLYDDIDNVKLGAKALEKLKEDKDTAFLSKTLAKIICDAPIGVDSLSDISVKEVNRQELLSLFAELEFSGFIKRMGLDKEESVGESAEPDKISTGELCNIAFDGPAAFCLKENTVEVCRNENYYAADLTSLSELAPFFEKNSLIVHDGKAMRHLLYDSGITEINIDFDVMLAAYVINSSDSSYELSKLTGAYLGTPSESALSLFALSEKLKERIAEDELSYLYYEVEQPLSSLLFKMELRGFMVDRQGLIDFSEMLEKEIASHLERIYAIAGHEFNVNSTIQLAAVLFDELKLPPLKKTKRGYSTDAEVLEKLRPYHEIVELILNYRQFAKLKSTYADGLLSVADSESRVHSSFNQTVTATGRLSSTEPNLQNIPIRTPLGHEMRKCFVAPKGYTLVDADYSQIELRLLAHISSDTEMTRAFLEGEDIHSSTAARVFGVPLEEVTPELRKRAKAINFGIAYGMGGFSLAADLGISKKEADEYISNYKSKFVGVSEYLSGAIETGYRTGYVTTMFGRRRYIPELSSSKAQLKNFGERVAMNSPIQGSAADIIKIAMVNTEKALEKSGIDAKIVLQVHDELILEAADNCVNEACELLKREMENAVKLSVPLTAEVSFGKRWFDCK